jgi:antitoxin ParD1/3/4
MNVSLTPELELLVNAKVKTGMYQTASEVIREGLRLLRERDESRAQLRADVQAGFAQIDSGRYSEFDERSTRKLAEDVKARGRRRLKKSKASAG